MVCSKNLNINPLVLDKLAFYRIEMILEAYEEYIEEENKQHKEHNDQYEKQMKSQQNIYNSNQKMDYGGFKPPTLNVPKFDMPRF